MRGIDVGVLYGSLRLRQRNDLLYSAPLACYAFTTGSGVQISCNVYMLMIWRAAYFIHASFTGMHAPFTQGRGVHPMLHSCWSVKLNRSLQCCVEIGPSRAARSVTAHLAGFTPVRFAGWQ
jgi:hypothetical protein